MRKRSWYHRQASVELVVGAIAAICAALFGLGGKTAPMCYLLAIAAVSVLIFAVFGRHTRLMARRSPVSPRRG